MWIQFYGIDQIGFTNLHGESGRGKGRGKGKESILLMIADAFLSYGYYDPVSDHMGYHRWIVASDDYGLYSDLRVIKQIDIDASLTRKLHKQYGGDIKAMVENYLLD